MSDSSQQSMSYLPLVDQHLHSWNSFDCKTVPRENILRAIEVGLSGLTFTDHFDTHPSEWDGCLFDDAKITRELSELREEFGDRIVIGKGIEVCYQPERMDFILDYLAEHDFDVVLLSIHWAGGKAVHVREQYEGWDAIRFMQHYLEAVRDATAHIAALHRAGGSPFHILGHLDFAKRYAKRYWDFEQPLDTIDAFDAMALIDAILTNCLEANLIPEINTSTLRNKMAHPMPGPEVVKRYAKLGGTSMSLGSDAHSPQYVGSHFADAVGMMREAGIENLAVFRGGALETRSID